MNIFATEYYCEAWSF